MKNRFILYRRKLGGMFYVQDSKTGKQESLGTKDRAEATALLNARNEAARQPQLNLLIAKAYLAGTDSGVSTRTWQNAFDAIIANKRGSTKERWERGSRQDAFDMIRKLVIIETQADHVLACMKAGTVSTNILLRELHNYCLAMNWLSWPIIQRKFWPKIIYQPKRAITVDEHQLIIGRERNVELRALYELCWHLGGSQTDMAHLSAENIDWSERVIAYARKKNWNSGVYSFRSGGGNRPALAPDPRTSAAEDCLVDGKAPCQRIQTPLRGFGHPGRLVAFLPLCLGGTRQAMRLPRAIRAGSARTQQQGRSPRLRPQGASQASIVGKLRKSKCGRPHRPPAPTTRRQWSLDLLLSLKPQLKYLL